MSKVTCKALFISLVSMFLISLDGYAQTNPLFQHRDIINKETHTSTVNSVLVPKVISERYIGSVVFDEEAIGENVYRFHYTPGLAEANATVVIEYWTYDYNTGDLRPDYTTFTFRISKSLISCGDDRVFTLKNESVSSISVLDNDSRTNDPLTLEGVSYVVGGVASIVGDKLDFVPDNDFVGDAFVYYSVKDGVGKNAIGKLKIKVVDTQELEEYQEIDLVSYGGVAVEIDLPFLGFTTSDDLSYGSFEANEGLYKYIPNGNSYHYESFTVSDGVISRKINVTLINKDRPNSWVIDDLVYTSKGTAVTFDVEKNDLKRDQEIISHSPDLLQGAESGVFNYTPEAYFSGSKAFEYTVFNGYESETGKIHIKVNNFYPQKQYDYNFNALSNSALIIEYLVPITNFSFEVISAPTNGTVNINSGTATIDLGCTSIEGTNLVMYQPNYNFTGSDGFELRYCVDGQCEDIEIKVQVVPNNLEDCQCFTGCVWSGDANNDGVVNVVDLLSMAYSIGSTGNTSELEGSSAWLGRKSADWFDSSVNGQNSKFADADGNGRVDELDFDAILENYDRNHALVPPQLLDSKAYPFTLEAIQDTVYAGDLVQFEIGIGNNQYPALDILGLAYSLGLPASLVDSSSVDLEYYSNAWLGVDEAVYGIYNQISDGWIETAVARLGTDPKSGAGPVGRLSFIVEEDLVGGFRLKNGIRSIKLKLSEGKAMDSNGVLAHVEGAEATVYLNTKDRRSNSDSISKLIAFPNPTGDVLNLHMNGGHDILSYEIYDLTGQRISSKSNLQTRNTSISTAGFNNGVYILRAITSFGPMINKFEVIQD